MGGKGVYYGNKLCNNEQYCGYCRRGGSSLSARGGGPRERIFRQSPEYYGNHFWSLRDGDKLIAFVDSFVDKGVTGKSTHGNVVWYQVRLTF